MYAAPTAHEAGASVRNSGCVFTSRPTDTDVSMPWRVDLGLVVAFAFALAALAAGVLAASDVPPSQIIPVLLGTNSRSK